MLKLLLIGSGAREHSIARAIKRSPQANSLFCYATSINPGIIPLCDGYLPGKLDDITTIVNFAKNHAIDIAIIGPELPLAAGVVDELTKIGVNSIGPCQQLAQIETSKSFCRDLLQSSTASHALPKYKAFANADDSDTILNFLESLSCEYVIKDDGLKGGKGVKIAGEHLHDYQQALDYCKEINGPFVIEEKLAGVEFSLLAFSDGNTLVHMPPVQDHKRAFTQDTGPNTGGMGSYTDSNHLLPFLNEEDIAAAKQINQATINKLKKKFNNPYQGFLYGGFMKTQNGIKLIEYNSRFGDPESINILALLSSDFIAICQAIVAGNLSQELVTFDKMATVVKYIVPKGYPNDPVKNKTIDLTQLDSPGNVYFAAVDQQDQNIIMTGSRAIAILGAGDTLSQAEQRAESLASKVKGEIFYRSDIGTTELINKYTNMVTT